MQKFADDVEDNMIRKVDHELILSDQLNAQQEKFMRQLDAERLCAIKNLERAMREKEQLSVDVRSSQQ